jgi:hypothetical protein
MSKQLTQLGYDISSFRNIGVEEAMTKLRSGIAGELEPLRSLGYDLSQAKLEATALSLGIDKAVSSMTQAEKAELRYYAIMTQLTDVHGDLARTLDAPANQLRVLEAQVKQAARALGDLFIPALNAILPIAIAVVKVITLVAKAIASLFGGTVGDVEFSGGGMSDLTEDATSAGGAIDDATGSAKKLRKTLLGIDELNVLPDASSGSGGGGGGGAGDGDGFDFKLPEYKFISDEVNNKINEIVEKMKEWLGLTDEVDTWSEFLHTRLGRILSLVGLIGAGLAAWKVTKGFLDAINTVRELLKVKSYSITIGAILTITGFTIAFTGMEDALTNGLDGFNFAEIVGGGLLGTGGAALLGGQLATWISTAFTGGAVDLAITQAGINLGVGTAGAVGTSLFAAISGVILGIPAMIVGIYDACTNGLDWLSGLLIPAGGAAAGAGIATILSAMGTAIAPGIGTLIGLAVGLLIDGIILLVQNWDTVMQIMSDSVNAVITFFSDLWGWVVSQWEIVAPWFDTYVIQPIAGFFGGLWEGISGAASACWETIVEFFSPAFEWFSELFGSVWQTISDIFYNIGVIASGCWEVIVAVWSIVSEWFDTKIIQPVGGFFSGLWEGISSAASNAWSAIKSVFSTITGWINNKIIQPVGNFFKGLWDGFREKASAAWNGVKTIFGKVASFFKDTFKKAWEGIVGVFSTAGKIFTDIKDGILTAFKSIVNGIIRGLNSAIALPFNGINWALDTIRNINILGLTPFSKLGRISVPQIPLLAQGGVVDSGQMFVAREAGAELVGNVGRKTAVMNNDQIVDSVSRGVYQAVVNAMGGSRGDQVVEAKVNDKVLFEVVVSRARQETMRTGFNPLLGGV